MSPPSLVTEYAELGAREQVVASETRPDQADRGRGHEARDGTGVGGSTWEFMVEHAAAAIQAIIEEIERIFKAANEAFPHHLSAGSPAR